MDTFMQNRVRISTGTNKTDSFHVFESECNRSCEDFWTINNILEETHTLNNSGPK